MLDPLEEIGSTEAAVQPLTGAMEPLEVSETSVDSVEAQETPWRKFAIKVCLSVTVFLVLTFLIESFADKEVTALSLKLMEGIGLPGLFLAVFLADGIPQPFTYVPLIFLAVKGSVPKTVVFLVCASASYSAALVGYAVGFHIRSLHCGDALFTRLSQEHPYVLELMKRRGAAGVALAAILPIPLALATWTAGSFRVYLPHFLLAGTCRMPKIGVFVLLSRAPLPVAPASVSTAAELFS